MIKAIRFSSKIILGTALAANLIFTVGCSRNNNPLNRKGEPIISQEFQYQDLDFPKGVPLFIATVKLVNPALLESVHIDENGKMQVDENLKERILAEQEDFILKLKGLSQDIRVVKQFRMVLNAITIEAPQEYAEQINNLPVDFIEGQKVFARPDLVDDELQTAEDKDLNLKNSMTNIGVDLIHKSLMVLNENGALVPVKGQGIKIGIIDSGIDYTHAMLGGVGSKSVYESINPRTSNEHFPNKKVVGGYDFVGTNFSPASHLYINNRPYPDGNPIDVTGHGTHVAGTAAGQGDGINTYDGAAPEAELYALKVFGDKGGGTSDHVVMTALEYAVDPNGDMSMEGKLDVVNLSLGNSYGRPADLYNTAVQNLTKAGVVAVGSAGNNGATPNIVSSPGVSDDLISVAASIDDMDHNILFDGVKIFNQDESKTYIMEFADGSISTSIGDVTALTGKLVYIGLGSVDLTEDQKTVLNGHIALMERGEVDFASKFTRAVSGGAVGVLMLNNQEGGPIRMGGEGEFDIPGVMVSLEDGQKIKEALALEDIFIDFKPTEKVRKEELINTIAEFSSQGPRSFDALIKPEVTAPGVRIISAQAGTGTEGVMNNGTSMAAPHIAGVAALLKQYRPDLTARDIKSQIMNTALSIQDASGKTYPISRQGAGLVQAFQAANSPIAIQTPALSLGKISVQDRVVAYKTLELKNISDSPALFSLDSQSAPELQISFDQAQISLEAGETKNISVKMTMTPPAVEVIEIDGLIQIQKNNQLIGQIPVLGVLNKTTNMSVQNFFATTPSAGQSIKNVSLNVMNNGINEGEALVFNLLGEDDRKPEPKINSLTAACDLESAGYRVIQKENEKVLQVAVKIFNPVSSWESCSLYVDFDKDGDEQPEYEIIGSFPSNWRLEDTPEINDLPLSSMLFDYKLLTQLWETYQAEVAKQRKKVPEVTFRPALRAIEPMTSYNSSTLAIVETKLGNLSVSSGQVSLRVSTSYSGRYNVQREDILMHGESEWKTVDISETGNSYFNIPEKLNIDAGSSLDINFLAGAQTNHDLVIYYPRNKLNLRTTGKDRQSEIVKVQPPEITISSTQL